MAKEVVIKADKIKKRNKRYSKTKIILSAILLFFIFSFIILSIRYQCQLTKIVRLRIWWLQSM